MVDPANPPPHASPLDRHVPKTADPAAMDHPMVIEVMAGRRYVIYPFVASLLFLSLNKNLGSVRVVRKGDWPMAPLLGATLITVLIGWWGFPWGLIWTPVALYHQWRGGRDLTFGILADAVGLADAKRILAMAPKPKPPGPIWLVRLLILVPVYLLVTIITEIAKS